MTQSELTSIINTYYSDKIQLATLKPADVNFLLYKPKSDGLKEFKGYSVILKDRPFDTEGEVRVIIDYVISVNHEWFTS